MANYRFLTIGRAGGVVTCTMGNPPRHTMVAREVAELRQFVDDLADDPTVRVVVFTGGGEDVFIRHYEVGELSESASRQTGQAPRELQHLHAMHQLILSLQRARFMTVAAINGNAAGGGFEFALGCDFRLAIDDDNYRLGLPETGVGIIPGAGGTQRYARLLGTAKALDLVLHGTLLSPREALAAGLIHRAFPRDSFAEDVRAFAETLAARAPIALAAAKRAIYEGSELPLEDGLAVEQREFDRTMASEDAAGAMRNLLAGKPWEWLGR
jgi:enoyl-CoA hydratase